MAATVYWNPRRSEIMRRTTRPDARLLPRSRYETANYRGRDELSSLNAKKKKKEKRAYRESLSFSPQNKWILLFRVIGAYQTGWTRISRLFSRTESTYRDREPKKRTELHVRFGLPRFDAKVREIFA